MSGLAPGPSRSGRPPQVWGDLVVNGDEVVAVLHGWRAVWAARRRLAIPRSCVVGVTHDPAAREHIRAKLRPRASRTGLIRLGSYHSIDGWSFWAIGLARNAVVVEASGARYRYVVVEVEDPAATVAELRTACGLGPR